MDVLALDPGNTTGWALVLRGVLVHAGHASYEALFETPPATSAPVLVVIEVPRVYPFGRGKGDNNDLIDLAVRVGELRGWYRRKSWVQRVELIPPRTWKGTVPKEIHNKQVLAKLSPEELAVLPTKRRGGFDHNMVDAVGLALWRAGR